MFGPGSPAHSPDISGLVHLGQNQPWNCLSGKVTSVCQIFMDQKRTEQEKRKEKKRKEKKGFCRKASTLNVLQSIYFVEFGEVDCSRCGWSLFFLHVSLNTFQSFFLLNKPAAAAEHCEERSEDELCSALCVFLVWPKFSDCFSYSCVREGSVEGRGAALLLLFCISVFSDIYSINILIFVVILFSADSARGFCR